MLAKTYSATHHGIEGVVIEIEVAKQRALPKICVTGLPGDVVRESRERVRACLNGLGFDVPTTQLLVHLSPASSRKQGSQFDLAIAMGVLVAEELLPHSLPSRAAFLGELSLDGRVQRLNGAIALVECLEKDPKIDQIILPRENALEASLIRSRKVRLAATIGEVIEAMQAKRLLPVARESAPIGGAMSTGTNLDDVIGQSLAKRSLQIALAGNHHLLLIGAPGVGKTLIASCTPQLLPCLDSNELIDVAKIYGIFPNVQRAPNEISRPFRAPHHTISGAGMLGGGSGIVIPGEVTLAHHGVLFLDEFPEYRKDVIEGLREPTQSGIIHLHRIGNAISLPAKFLLLAAMNPCPCGYALRGESRCACAWERVRSYRKRISGAILDRVDLGVVMSAPKKTARMDTRLSHQSIKASICRVREIQKLRKGGRASRGLTGEASKWFESLVETGQLSYRGLDKVGRVARTIADLAENETIEVEHLMEANSLRCPDGLADRPL